MADCNFLEKAIQLVKQASEADEKENYKEAFRLYSLSLEYFLTALKCTSFLSFLFNLDFQF
jgi:vacuolar protein-sorting-associated protein 4